MRSEYAANLALTPIAQPRPRVEIRTSRPVGSVAIPFSELVADTAAKHGAEWTREWLASKMPAWEVAFWMVHAR